MQLEQQNVFQRLWTILRLLWPNPFRRPSHRTETHFSAPDSWKSLPRPDGRPVELGDLRRVIPIVQMESAAGIALTLISLESYDNGYLVHGQFTAKHGERSHENMWMANPIVTVSDDVGTAYRWWRSGGGDLRFTCGFAPALNPNAHELRFTVTHIGWIFFGEQRHELDEGPWSFRFSLE